MRVRVIRSHRPESWTRVFIGEYLWTERAEPTTEMAGVLNAPFVPEPILGWDVDQRRLTPRQRQILWKLCNGYLIGQLFLPVECAEPAPEFSDS